MAEPAASAVATVVVPVAAAGSISTIVLAAVGVDATTIGWALAGGFFGAAYAPKTHWIKASAGYLFASFISALGASVLMAWLDVDTAPARYLCAAVASFAFYPLKEALVANIGDGVVKPLLARIFGPRKEEPRP